MQFASLDAIRVPSGDQATPHTGCADRWVTRVSPVAASHTRAVPSWLAVTIRVRSGDQAGQGHLTALAAIGDEALARRGVPHLGGLVGAGGDDALPIRRPRDRVQVGGMAAIGDCVLPGVASTHWRRCRSHDLHRRRAPRRSRCAFRQRPAPQVTGDIWPVKVRTCLPVCVSHTCAVWSCDVETARALSGDQEME